MISLDEALAAGRGVERPFTCHAHPNTSVTASVNVMKGVWYCYSCNAYGELADHDPKVEDLIAVLAGTVKPRVLPESWLDIFDADYSSPYWVSRVGIDVAYRNRCGTDLLTGAPTYPLRDADGGVLGVVTRHERVDPKYRYPYGVSTSQTLYTEPGPCEVLVLVEGAGDVMALQQAGLPARWGVAGCFGAGLHHPQVALVAAKNPSIVIAAFDDDDAGQRACDRSEMLLDGLVPVLSHRWSSVGGKDPGDVPLHQRINSLESTLHRARPQPHRRTQ